MKELQNNSLLHSVKNSYVKPTMQVYEMEVEGAIMEGMSTIKACSSLDDDGPEDYDYTDSWY